MATPADGMRIDTLARKARTTTRNVRAYASRGLLPPPELKGRTAFYGDAHLARLRLIDRLAARGFSLASIQELIQAWERQQDLPQLLGLEAAVTTPSAGGNRVVSLAELKRLAPELAKTPKLLQRAVKLELLAKEGAQYRILNERALRVGRALADAGIPPAAALESLAPLKAAMEPRVTMRPERRAISTSPRSSSGCAPSRPRPSAPCSTRCSTAPFPTPPPASSRCSAR